MEIRKGGRSKIRKSDEFLEIVQDFSEVLFVTHDNPDPDGLACGWALGELIRQKLDRQYRLLARGAVLRAENRHLLKLLRPPLELQDNLVIDAQALVVLIDCRPEAFNHMPLGDTSLAVIDHHKSTEALPPTVRFADLRPDVAASASIAACYLREQEVEPSAALATALTYAIRTEAGGGSVSFSQLDQEMFNWTSRFVLADLLAEIEEAPLPRAYFRDLVHALQSTTVIQNVAYCMLPSVAAPETIGEVADLLIRCEGMQAVLCWGRHEERLILSTRTRRGSRKDAAEMIHKVVQGLGHSGGHEHRAGGLIPLHEAKESDSHLMSIIRYRWLLAAGVQDAADEALVESLPFPFEPYIQALRGAGQ